MRTCEGHRPDLERSVAKYLAQQWKDAMPLLFLGRVPVYWVVRVTGPGSLDGCLLCLHIVAVDLNSLSFHHRWISMYF